MREGSQRQQFSRRGATSPAVVLLALILLTNFSLHAEGGRDEDLAKELIAARLLEEAAALRSERGEPVDIEKLEQMYQRIIARHPGSAETHNAYGAHLWARREFARAQEQWQMALKLDPDNADAAFDLGQCELKLGNPGPAVRLLRRAMESAPGRAAFHFAYANALYIFRKEDTGVAEDVALTTALSHFKRATEIEPQNLHFARGYAETFYVLPNPDWQEALNAWTTVRDLSQEKDFATLHLARVQLKLGNRVAAKALLEDVQSPKHKRIKKALLQQTEPQ